MSRASTGSDYATAASVVGLKMCQQANVQEGTHNVTLVNCFRWLSFATFPAQAELFNICVVLTDGLGEGTLTLAIRSLEDWGDVWTQSMKLSFPDPVAERWFLFPVSDCEFPQDGSYQVELEIDGESLGRTVLRVLRA